MCTVTIKIDVEKVRRINPSLKDMDAITRWAQRLFDNLIENLLAEVDDSSLKPQEQAQANEVK